MSDARALENTLNGQLIRWLVDFNFGPDVPAPRLVIDTTSTEDFEANIQIDRQLVGLGIPLSKAYFYEKYKRPEPRANDPLLCFDDQNLFQYHLQYGIVTVNEARERLGMAPAPWGRTRVCPLAAPKTGASTSAAEDKIGMLETAMEQESPEQGK